jgi:hypothetical protein
MKEEEVVMVVLVTMTIQGWMTMPRKTIEPMPTTTTMRQ